MENDLVFDVVSQINHLNAQIGFAKEECQLALEQYNQEKVKSLYNFYHVYLNVCICKAT